MKYVLCQWMTTSEKTTYVWIENRNCIFVFVIFMFWLYLSILCDGLDVGQTVELSPHVRHEENFMLGTMTLLIEGELQSEIIH